MLSLFLYIPSTLAQTEGFGLGIAAGDPAGVTGKYWLDERQAVDLTLGWATVDHDGFQINADYLFHNIDFLKLNDSPLPLYAGVGPRLIFSDKHYDRDTSFGLRFPLGITYPFPRDPVEVFAEVVPGFDIAPSATFQLDWDLGFRLYFN